MRSARPQTPALTRPDRPTLRITWHCSLGGVVSPLLANIYLHRLDKAWRDGGGVGVLVRYCDDLVVLCRSQKEAESALVALTEILHGLGLEPKASKTRIVHLAEGGEGLDFLGFHRRSGIRPKGLGPAIT